MCVFPVVPFSYSRPCRSSLRLLLLVRIHLGVLLSFGCCCFCWDLSRYWEYCFCQRSSAIAQRKQFTSQCTTTASISCRLRPRQSRQQQASTGVHNNNKNNNVNQKNQSRSAAVTSPSTIPAPYPPPMVVEHRFPERFRFHGRRWSCCSCCCCFKC